MAEADDLPQLSAGSPANMAFTPGFGYRFHCPSHGLAARQVVQQITALRVSEGQMKMELARRSSNKCEWERA